MNFPLFGLLMTRKERVILKNVAMNLKATIIDESCKPRHQNSNIIDDMQLQP